MNVKYFLKKWLNLGLLPIDIITDFYLNSPNIQGDWVSVVVNRNTLNDQLLTKELEILTVNDAHFLKLSENHQGILHSYYKNQVMEAQHLFSRKDFILTQFNSLVDRLIENELVIFQKGLSNIDQKKQFNTSEITNDEKALEWIKATFKLLEKAIIESLTNQELLFQVMLFLGKNKKTSHQEIRLIIFNLDIKFELLPNGLLRLRIYNDKDGAFGNVKKSSLEGDFNFRKREIFDELTSLLSLIGPGIKCL